MGIPHVAGKQVLIIAVCRGQNEVKEQISKWGNYVINLVWHFLLLLNLRNKNNENSVKRYCNLESRLLEEIK